MRKYGKLVGSLVLGLLAWPVHLPASAILDEPVLGGQILVAEAGDVTATFLGSDAAFFNSLYLDSPDGQDEKIFDKDTALGSTIDLGAFTADTELMFRLDVYDTGFSYFTGDGSRNPDGVPHAEAITTFDEISGQYITEIGFEDLYGGGDEDYNDFMFRVSNTIDPVGVPEPPVLALLIMGVVGMGFARRRAARKGH